MYLHTRTKYLVGRITYDTPNGKIMESPKRENTNRFKRELIKEIDCKIFILKNGVLKKFSKDNFMRYRFE